MQRVLLLGLLTLVRALAGDLFEEFRNPPREYSVRPFWFWNGKLDENEVKRQISEMVSQGVYGAYVHNRTGLETPYLSEEYFKIAGAALSRAKELGFKLGFVDEYEWPGGDARDVWMKGLPSRVVGANAEFRMRGLRYRQVDLEGPEAASLPDLRNFQFAYAARLRGLDHIDGESVREVSSAYSSGRLAWEAPEGRWRLIAFYLEDSQGEDGGVVDLMNPRAVRKFLDLVHEQYYFRFREHFGSTIDSIYGDHEGDFGGGIAWTPALFEVFQEMKGYDLRPNLPLLIWEGGNRTPKVRCDYYDVVSELYTSSFFRQVAEWSRAHGIRTTGHTWEESLQQEAQYAGDLYRINRAWSWPGVDSLARQWRWPREFKPTASAAHFRGVRFTCENQGIQDRDSYFDLQRMRAGTNMIAIWGANLFIPHAFNYHATRIEFPPDWFFHQPFWKYFRHYADYARRLSFMNDGGRHVAEVLLFHPIETAWAHANAKFSLKPDWNNNPLPGIEQAYSGLMNTLTRVHWDYDTADSSFLAEARIADGRLHIGEESFRVLVLPPMTTIRRSSLKKIRAFFEHGGAVISVNRLPHDSMEHGREDPEIAREIRSIFGAAALEGRATENAHPEGGRAFLVQTAAEVPDLLVRLTSPDVAVVSGPAANLYVSHREKQGVKYYLAANSSARPLKLTVRFKAAGQPEKWNAEAGTREPLFSVAKREGTEVELSFAPWEAYYVVFTPGAARIVPRSPARVTDVVELNGEWRFKPEQNELTAPYAMCRADPVGVGETEGWHLKGADEYGWTRHWLSRERMAINDWWLIGPFPNEDHRGFETDYGPESDQDVSTRHGSFFKWQAYKSPSYAVDLVKAFNLPPETNTTAARVYATGYALTYVYSPESRRVRFLLAANHNAKLWVNGLELLNWHIHPFWYDLRDEFALSRWADLKAGWNAVLLKISRCGVNAGYGFFLRIADACGNPIPALFASRERSLQKAPPEPGWVWYRIPVPASAVGVRLPPFSKELSVFYNGRPVRPDAAGHVNFQPAEGPGNVLAVRVRFGEDFPDAPKFKSGRTAALLGSWTQHGLPHYSGSAYYEKDFTLPSSMTGRQLTLDCGEVGGAAEVWLNGVYGGTRVWLPYTFDISKIAKTGNNRVRIVVTNTMDNERAVENRAAQLQRIQHNGLLGPVRVEAR